MGARDEIERRQVLTEALWEKAAFLASSHFEPIGTISSRACIYVTGSVARGEATEGSDLDLFVVDQLSDGDSSLDYVQTSHLVAKLDAVRQDAGFRSFSRGGQFIRTHSFKEIVELIGDPRDDAENAFTARILLLINSRPLVNESAYSEARRQILDKYWAPQQPNAPFRPIMLLNDLRRWWGVVCLNFERYNPVKVVDQYTAVAGYERRINNLKLRHARVLAAYSPILRLIQLSDSSGFVEREQAEAILGETPVARIQALEVDQALSGGVRSLATEVLDRYDTYLAFMDKGKGELERAVSVEAVWTPLKEEAYEFHRKFAELLRTLGQGKTLFDYTLV